MIRSTLPLRPARFAFEAHASPFLDKAFGPQRAWYERARKEASHAAANASPLGAVPLALCVAQSAFARVQAEEAEQTHEALHDRRKGHALLCLLFALGELNSSVSPSLNQESAKAVLAFCDKLIASSLPVQIADATLRLVACVLSQPASSAELLRGVHQRHGALLHSLIETEGTSPWLQEAALFVLAQTNAPAFECALIALFASPRGGDGLFLRARLARLLVSNAPGAPILSAPTAAALWPLLIADPSETVRRETVVAAASRASSGTHAGASLAHALLATFGTTDASVRVRAAAIDTLAAQVSHACATRVEIELLQSLSVEALAGVGPLDPVLARTAMRALRAGAQASVFEARSALFFPVLPSLASALSELPLHSLFRGASAREWHLLNLVEWIAACSVRSEALRGLSAFVKTVPSGSARRIPKELTAAFASGEELGRALSLVAAEDYGFELTPVAGGGWSLTRGHVFGFRLWRFLFELRTPASGKRQAFAHTIGRVFEGSIHVPSQILCELAQTKVPGEPLYLPDDEGWRPAVPLTDELVSAAFLRGPLLVVVPEGTTRVAPPQGLFARFRAYFFLSAKFESFARARNWTQGQQAPASEYVDMARAAGFEVSFTPFSSAASHATLSLVRFFRTGSQPPQAPAGALASVARSLTDPVTVVAGAASMHATWGSFQRYVADANANTLGELVVFLCAMMFLFVGAHLLRHARFRRARAGLPLVLGGWGTRGKSGTERLKAALFSSVGFGVVSKATGCEATLLLCAPFGPLQDFPLYRSYDKATIWEQQNVVEFASSFGTNVFLWECMGLTPDYVQILQNGWMRDDISTLTNTYPDHEDLQGPAGINIPQVMQNFIPKKALLCTTEEQMLPLLRETAEQRGSEFRSAGWREAGAVPAEVMALFPYDEHPYNVALVLEVADACGLDPLYALKAMTENVVPDIGVLKTYPRIEGHGRALAFSNGCSANERHGCLGNWERLGFNLPADKVPVGTFVTTFLNNRADRVARSQVFARVVTFDLSADRHFLVGSNLPGLMGFLDQALEEYLRTADLWYPADPTDGSLEAARALALVRLRHPFNHLRLAHCDAQVQAELGVMIGALEPSPGRFSQADRAALLADFASPDRIEASLRAAGCEENAVASARAHLANRLAQVNAWNELSAASQNVTAFEGREASEINRRLREFVREQFKKKIVTVDEETQADGDSLVDFFLRALPPGFEQRLMGTQNIKGPGLTLIYRLETWLALVRVLGVARTGPLLKARQACEALGGWTDIPAFARSFARAGALAALSERGEALGPEGAAALGALVARLSGDGPKGGAPAGAPQRAQGDKLKPAAASSAYARPVYPAPPPEASAFVAPVLEFIEPIRAVLRRRKADRIYRAVADGRMTLADASYALRELSVEV